MCRPRLHQMITERAAVLLQYDWHQLTPYVQNELGHASQLNETYVYASHANLRDSIQDSRNTGLATAYTLLLQLLD